MKFVIGDPTDSAHCIALAHEFFRCEDAFMEFEHFAAVLIQNSSNKWLAYRTYNAYSRFLHSLYEFTLGAIAREKGNTKITNKKEPEKSAFIDSCVRGEAQRVLSGRRSDIIAGVSPKWENELSYFPEEVPESFARDFRNYRNKASGHVAHERALEISLSWFYSEYHKFVHMLYHSAAQHWGLNRQKTFPDLGEITKFSVMLKRKSEPNQAPQTTTRTVTDRAPSSTLRASASRV